MRELLRQVDRLQRLAVFESAGRLGSFTAAAKDLGMTQPAVTRQIRSLELSLGTELFRRTANRSELTEVGARLSDHVAAGFDVRLWLFDRDSEIVGGGFDAAVRVGTGEFSGQSSHLLFGERVVPVTSPAFAEQHGLSEASSAHDVYEVPFVHMDDGDHPWMTWANWLAEFDITLRRQPGRVLFHNYPMVLQQALAGRGVALGWRTLIDELVAGDALVVVGPEVTSNRGYYVTWPAGEPDTGVSALVTWLTSLT